MLNFYEYLKKVKTNGQFNNSLIVNNQFMVDYLELSKMYLKSLTCNNQIPYCDHCVYCNKINNNAYVDFVFLQDNEQNHISKQDIIDLQTKFLKPAVEEIDIKLYVIKNIEQLNKQCLNALLKFIEDSPKNTYNLFFSTNPNKIIKTITSRSNLIKINDQPNNKISHIDLIENIFNDINDYETFIKEYDFDSLINLTNQLMNISNVIDEVTITKQLSKLSKYELNVFFKILLLKVTINKKQMIMKLLNDLKLNINQKNLVIKLVNLIKEK